MFTRTKCRKTGTANPDVNSIRTGRTPVNNKGVLTMKFTLSALLLILSSTVYAAGNDVSNSCPGNSCHGGEGGSSDATAASIAAALAISNATGGTGGAASATTGPVNAAATTGPVTATNGGNVFKGGDTDVDAPFIPAQSSIAVGSNGTAGCLVDKRRSFNVFVASAAWGGHEVEPVCKAQELGQLKVATQIMCNTDSAYRKAYNQVAEHEGTPACL